MTNSTRYTKRAERRVMTSRGGWKYYSSEIHLKLRRLDKR